MSFKFLNTVSIYSVWSPEPKSFQKYKVFLYQPPCDPLSQPPGNHCAKSLRTNVAQPCLFIKIAVYISFISHSIIWACPLSFVRTLTCTKTVLACPVSLGRQNELQEADSDISGALSSHKLGLNEGLDLRGFAAVSQGHLKTTFFYNDLCFWACYFGPLGITAHAAVSRLILWLEADRREQDLIHHGQLHRDCQSFSFSQGRRANMEWTNEKRWLGRWSVFCGFFKECPWTLKRVSCKSKRFEAVQCLLFVLCAFGN